MERNRPDLDRAFNPRCVAVVGDKKQTNYMWLRSLSTFTGKVYSVQIDPSELPGIAALGVPNYRSLLDIPEPVDYVVCAVPRAASPKIVADCIKKGVGAVTLFTSGFAETNTEEGLRLQKLITQMARDANLNLIGPNCMGIFNPRLGVRHSPDQYYGDGGSVGFISQSGTHATFFSLVGNVNGVRVSKSVSYGNAVVLDSVDFLHYLGEDAETKIIGLYIEGVRHGRRFFETLSQVAQQKPVLIWKGGQTEEGARATASHTASLAESPLVWEALIRQCGAIKVDSLDEMIDTIKALLYLKPPAGKRVGLLAMTGGQSVVITDTFAKAGLEVPLLSTASYERLAQFFNIIGGSYRNPLDIGSTFVDVGPLEQMMYILSEDPKVDSVILEFSVAFMARRWASIPHFLDNYLAAMATFRQQSSKAFLVVLNPVQMETEAVKLRAQFLERNISTFPDFGRAARALRRMVDYYQAHQN